MTTFIESKRLIVKAPCLDDFDALYELQSDPDVMHFVGEGVRTKAEVLTSLKMAIEHYAKHGFSFGNVIEKKSGKVIGRAGLIYLACDDTQPEIEFGYALHQAYWGKGYATELSTALIAWGFNHLPIKKLVGIIHPANDRSRRVLEKAGLHYVRKEKYHAKEVARYEIIHLPITSDKISVIPAALHQYPIMQNMARFYVYEMSEFLGFEAGWELQNDGLYECFDLKQYWNEANTFPFLIKYQNELAGFVIVNKCGSSPQTDFNMAQFFILRKFKRKGIGKYVAEYCFNTFPGKWEVMVMPRNENAYRFWRAIIREYTGNHFQEYTQPINNKNNEYRNIFSFTSNTNSA